MALVPLQSRWWDSKCSSSVPAVLGHSRTESGHVGHSRTERVKMWGPCSVFRSRLQAHLRKSGGDFGGTSGSFREVRLELKLSGASVRRVLGALNSIQAGLRGILFQSNIGGIEGCFRGFRWASGALCRSRRHYRKFQKCSWRSWRLLFEISSSTHVTPRKPPAGNLSNTKGVIDYLHKPKVAKVTFFSRVPSTAISLTASNLNNFQFDFR